MKNRAENVPGSSRDLAMQVWVDADACPSEIKELLFRAATRREIKVSLVANQQLRTPKSEYVEGIAVQASMNVADRFGTCWTNHARMARSPEDLRTSVSKTNMPCTDDRGRVENGGRPVVVSRIVGENVS